MPLVVIVGLGWGDEGKGKIVDCMSEGASVVARFSGGANAGHTVHAGNMKLVLHQLPTGLLREGVTGIIGAGCVIDPVSLREEARLLEKQGVAAWQRLQVSPHAHLVHPCYRLEERADEEARGAAAIGTTLRGIGPAYVRKYGRRGLRVEDALRSRDFAEKSMAILSGFGSEAAANLRADVERFVEDSCAVASKAGDISSVILGALAEGRLVLAEGAQGTLLDPDAGTYPYVTSGSCVSGAACSSLGIGPSRIDEVVGVVKAYATRVGSGPFPTELEGPLAEHIRLRGNEYGATTGRPRRCGWFDGPLSAYASRTNGCHWLAITLLDVLGGIDILKLSNGFDGSAPAFPLLGEGLSSLRPVYEDMKGWPEEIGGIRIWEELPEAARNYVIRVEALSGAPVRLVSTGPDRSEVIWRRS